MWCCHHNQNHHKSSPCLLDECRLSTGAANPQTKWFFLLYNIVAWPTASRFADWSKRCHVMFIIITLQWLHTAQLCDPASLQLANFARSSNRWRWKLQEPQLRRLFPAGWIIAIRWSTVCRTLYCTSCSLCRMPLHDWSLAWEAVIIYRRYYVNSIGCLSESASSSTWHAWFASHCPGRRLSTWPTTAVSCPTALGALCGQLMFRLAWCRKHSAVMATELFQAWDLACGTLPVQLRNPGLRTVPTKPEGTPFSGSMNTALCDFWYLAP